MSLRNRIAEIIQKVFSSRIECTQGNVLIGRETAGNGFSSEILVGDGLTLSGGVLRATAPAPAPSAPLPVRLDANPIPGALVVNGNTLLVAPDFEGFHRWTSDGQDADNPENPTYPRQILAEATSDGQLVGFNYYELDEPNQPSLSVRLWSATTSNPDPTAATLLPVCEASGELTPAWQSPIGEFGTLGEFGGAWWICRGERTWDAL